MRGSTVVFRRSSVQSPAGSCFYFHRIFFNYSLRKLEKFATRLYTAKMGGLFQS